MTPEILLFEAERQGVNVFLDDQGKLKLRGPELAVKALQPELAKSKTLIVQELIRRNEQAVLAEWHVDCRQFFIAAAAQDDPKRSACLRCGGSWELHGKPARRDWDVVHDPETVETIAARFVLATAERIASEAHTE